MVAADKFQILRGNRIHLYVGGDDESVDHVVLEIIVIGTGVCLIERAAGRMGIVHDKLPFVGEGALVELAAVPAAFVFRVHAVVGARESLVEIAAGDDIIALICLFLQNLPEHLCLRRFALAAVVGFQVQIDAHELLARILSVFIEYRRAVYEQTALEVAETHRPFERARQLNPACVLKGAAGCGHDAGVDLADRRDRVRNEFYFIVIGKIPVGSAFRQNLRFIDMAGPGCVGVDLLHEKIIGIHCLDL